MTADLQDLGSVGNTSALPSSAENAVPCSQQGGQTKSALNLVSSLAACANSTRAPASATLALVFFHRETLPAATLLPTVSRGRFGEAYAVFGQGQSLFCGQRVKVGYNNSPNRTVAFSSESSA